MIIYPAIDVRGGKVVRLVQGDPQQQTVFSHSPLETAEQWRNDGSEWLHVVNLGGALGEGDQSSGLVKELAGTGLKIQFGGGLRSFDDIQLKLDDGVARVVLGTMVVKEPDLANEAVQRFGVEQIAVALDAKNGLVSMHGWQKQTKWTPVELGHRFASMGIRYALYTDINRDGKLHGANVQGVAELARKTGLAVIASGGVSSLEDIRALRQANTSIDGVVIGKALYTGALSLKEALAVSRESD